MRDPSYNTNRREFISSLLPVCAATCILGGSRFASAQATDENNISSTDIFEQKLDQEFTYRRFFAIRYYEFIQFIRPLEKEWGEDKLITFLKKNAEERRFNDGQNQAKKLGDNSLEAYAKQLRPPAYKNLLVHEIVEDTEAAFEIKVTKCIWAETFLNAGMGDIGHAHICHGDYSHIKGFNPVLKMVRDKTLMQGYDCCNHRYEMVDPF